MNTCDIIIPAYNSEETLPLVLESIAHQDVSAAWKIQVLVCDDGSSDATARLATTASLPYPITVLAGGHAGVAAARNRGIQQSRADILFFLGSDIILQPHALAAHLALHEKQTETEVAGLGIVVWDPRIQPTPLMEWMNHGGVQNDFDAVLGKTYADPAMFFYGSHISVKRKLVESEQFNEAFTAYGHEDHELGVRLAVKGLRLLTLHSAIGLHRHIYTPDRFFARQYAVGQGKHILAEQLGQPAPDTTLSTKHRIQQIVYAVGIGGLLRQIVRIVGPRWAAPRLFAHSAGYEYRRGVLHS